VELWDQGELADRVDQTQGLLTVRLGGQGLRLNGKPYLLRGIARCQLDPQAAASLRAAGINALCVPVESATLKIWPTADELGFFVLGTINSEESLRLALTVADHPSFLACIIDEDAWLDSGRRAALTECLHGHPRITLGVRLQRGELEPATEAFRFIMCDESQLSQFAQWPLPKLLWMKKGTGEAPALPGVLGWILE
jgi:hypothetical protein